MQTTETPAMPSGWRVKTGMVLFALAIVPYWALAPIVFRDLPLPTIATLTAAGAIMGKVFLVGAVMVLGKSGFAVLKAKLFHQLSPPQEVGPVRYRIGLVMFFLPILGGIFETYASHVIPHLILNRLWVDLLFDAMMVASLFVLGGSFWDKIRALFVVDARAVFPKNLA